MVKASWAICNWPIRACVKTFAIHCVRSFRIIFHSPCSLVMINLYNWIPAKYVTERGMNYVHVLLCGSIISCKVLMSLLIWPPQNELNFVTLSFLWSYQVKIKYQTTCGAEKSQQTLKVVRLGKTLTPQKSWILEGKTFVLKTVQDSQKRLKLWIQTLFSSAPIHLTRDLRLQKHLNLWSKTLLSSISGRLKIGLKMLC